MAKAWHYNNLPLDTNTGWTNKDGITHEANWVAWSVEQKEDAGLELLEVLDERFYNIIDRSEKPLQEIVNSEIEKIEIARKNLLDDTQYAVIDEELYGNPMPEEVLESRANIEVAANATINKIKSATSLEELVSFYESEVVVTGVRFPNINANWGVDGQGNAPEESPNPQFVVTKS